jgi:PAS domain S-box-containing protein
MRYENLEGLAQALFEESGDALFLFDPSNEQLLDANALAQRLSGFSLRDLLQLPLPQLIRFGGKDGLQRLREATGKTVAFHAQEGYFLRTVQPDVWVPINLTVSRLHVKPDTLALLTARDAREQRKTQHQLRQAEADLQRVLLSISDCVWSGRVNEGGNIVLQSVSPSIASLVGQPPEFFLTGINRWWHIVHPQDQPRWLQSLSRLRLASETKEEYRVVRPDGTVRWVQEHIRASLSLEPRPIRFDDDVVSDIRGNPAPEPRLVRLDGVVSDITAQKEIEQKGALVEARFSGLIDDSPVVAFLKDAEGRLVYCNKSFTWAFRTTVAPLLGKTDFDLFPAALARELSNRDAAALAASSPLEALQRIPTADGLRHWLVLRFPVVRAGGQRLLAALGLDLTGRASLLEQFREGTVVAPG